jgi:hypothetical protein
MARDQIQTTRNSPRQNEIRDNNPSITRASRMRQNINLQEEDAFIPNQNAQSVKYRVGSLVTLLLLLFATFLDGAELLLDLVGTALGGVGVVIGYIKDFLTVIVLPSIFLFLKIPFWKGKKAKKKMAMMIGSFLASLIPWVGAFLPETLASVWVTLRLTKKEDEEKAQEKTVIQQQNSAITRLKRER